MDAITLRCPRSGGIDGTLLSDFSILSGARGLVITDDCGVSPAYGLLRSSFERIVLRNLTDAGVYADTGEILETSFKNVYISGGAHSAYFDICAAINVVSFRDCQFRESTELGMHLRRPGSVLFDNALFESHEKSALQIIDPRYGVLFLGGWFEHNGTNMTGGPYPVITTSMSAPSPIAYGPIRFLGTFFHLTGAVNTGLYVYHNLADGYAGDVIFDGVFFYVDPRAKIDVGSFTTVPGVVTRNVVVDAYEVIGTPRNRLERISLSTS